MSKLFRTALWIFSGLGLIGFISQTVITLLISPLMGIISILIAAILVAVVIALLRLSPMWARPARVWAPLAFLWGSGMAISLASMSSPAVMQLAINSGWIDSFMSWSGAYPEEISKATGVLFVLMSFRQLNRPWHGWMVGAVIGLGFEANENILYGSMGATTHPDSDFTGLIQMWGLRLIAGPGLHVLLTALAGWGIGWALYRCRQAALVAHQRGTRLPRGILPPPLWLELPARFRYRGRYPGPCRSYYLVPAERLAHPARQ